MRRIPTLAIAAALFAAHAATAAAGAATTPPGRTEPPAVVHAVVNLAEIARLEAGKVLPLPPCREVDRPQPIPHEFALPPGVPVMGRRARRQGSPGSAPRDHLVAAAPRELRGARRQPHRHPTRHPRRRRTRPPDDRAQLPGPGPGPQRPRREHGLARRLLRRGQPRRPVDPKVLYDPYGDRFVIAACGAGPAANSSALVGVSQTSDPTGNWNLYKFDADPADLLWADYPSLGFNKDWVVVNVNIFTINSGNAVRGDIYVIDKGELYAGAGSPRRQVLSDLTAFTLCPAITYDATLAVEYLVQTLNAGLGTSG